MKQRINLYVDGTLWREYRAACVRRGESASEVTERLISAQVASWESEAKVSQKVSPAAPTGETGDTSGGGTAS